MVAILLTKLIVLEEDIQKEEGIEEKEHQSLDISDMDRDIEIQGSISENGMNFNGAINKNDIIHKNENIVINRESEKDGSER